MTQNAKVAALLQAREPGHSLPQGLYNDPEVFDFDLAAIFARSWLFAGFEAEAREPGSYLSFTVGRSPVVIVRGQDGILRGFHNSCRHRGAELCPVGAGRKARLVCPYHQWVYGLTGELLSARHMPADFDPRLHGLRPVHVEAVMGSLYVCLAETAPDFGPFRADLEPMLAPHNLREGKVAYECTLVERGNWKLVMENARECYHCVARHPELARIFPVQPGASQNGGVALADASFKARMEAQSLAVGPLDGPWWQVSRFPLTEGSQTLTLDGRPAVRVPLCDGGDIGSMRWALDPNSFCHATSDSVFAFSAMPTGPNETVVTAKWLVHRDAVEGRDYTIEGLTTLWDITNRQDRDLVEANQRGINSVGYAPGPYNREEESLVLRFVDWYCEKAADVIQGRRHPERSDAMVPGPPKRLAQPPVSARTPAGGRAFSDHGPGMI